MPQTSPATLPNLGIAMLEVGATDQALRVNDAFLFVDALLQGSVKDKDLATPPGSPTAGDRYIVASSPTGAWSGHAKHVALYYNGAWYFFVLKKGATLHVEDESKDYQYDGSSWVERTSTVTTAPTWTVAAKTADFTASVSEAAVYLIDATSANVTVTLPAASGVGSRGFFLKRTDATGNTVTIDGNGSDTIDGSATKALAAQYDVLRIVSDGTNWMVL